VGSKDGGGAREEQSGRFNERSEWVVVLKEARGEGELIATRAQTIKKQILDILFRRFISRPVSLGLIFPPIIPIGLSSAQSCPLLGSTEDPLDLSTLHEMWRVFLR
jgi:hypothetical protein